MNANSRVSFHHVAAARWTGEERRKLPVQRNAESGDQGQYDLDFDPGRGVVYGVLGGLVLWALILIPLWALFF